MEPIAEKKKLILESALGLIKDHGFHGCPMSTMAKNAGVAAGTIYTYFDSKDELIRELYFYTIGVVHTHMTECEDRSLDFKERFYNYWKCLTQLYLDRPEIQRFFEQFIISPFNTSEIQSQHSLWHEWNTGFFEEGIRKGYLKNLSPDVLFFMVIGTVNVTVRVRQGMSAQIIEKGIDINQLAEMTWDAIKKQ